MIYIFDAGLGKTRRGSSVDSPRIGLRAAASWTWMTGTRERGIRRMWWSSASRRSYGNCSVILFWLCRCMNNGQEPDRPAAVRPRDTGAGHGHAGKNRGNVLVVVCCDSSCVSSRRGRDERGATAPMWDSQIWRWVSSRPASACQPVSQNARLSTLLCHQNAEVEMARKGEEHRISSFVISHLKAGGIVGVLTHCEDQETGPGPRLLTVPCLECMWCWPGVCCLKFCNLQACTDHSHPPINPTRPRLRVRLPLFSPQLSLPLSGLDQV